MLLSYYSVHQMKPRHVLRNFQVPIRSQATGSAHGFYGLHVAQPIILRLRYGDTRVYYALRLDV